MGPTADYFPARQAGTLVTLVVWVWSSWALREGLGEGLPGWRGRGRKGGGQDWSEFHPAGDPSSSLCTRLTPPAGGGGGEGPADPPPSWSPSAGARPASQPHSLPSRGSGHLGVQAPLTFCLAPPPDPRASLTCRPDSSCPTQTCPGAARRSGRLGGGGNAQGTLSRAFLFSSYCEVSAHWEVGEGGWWGSRWRWSPRTSGRKIRL